MAADRIHRFLRRVREDQSLRPDFARALRATTAFMIPMVLAATIGLPVEAAFAAIAAQNIAMVDVRGANALRASLLLAMIVVLAASAALGALVSQHLLGAVLVTSLIALCCGAWRHLNAEYGGPLAIASMLVLLLALASPEGPAVAAHHAIAVIAGGLLGFLLQVAFWPFRPQHPLRQVVAESWLAAADLFAALAPETEEEGIDGQKRHEKVAAAEAALRAAIDKAMSALIQADVRRRSVLIGQLEALNLAAARLAVRVAGLNTAMEALPSSSAGLAPAFQPALTALANFARSTALTAVSRQPSHLARCEVRQRRTANLLRVLCAHLEASGEPHATRLEVLLRQIDEQLPATIEALRATTGRADERAAFSLELLDLNTWTLRPLASALNLRPCLDPALVRYTLRLATLTIVGVAFYKLLRIPHGYWLPFTMVVVLQPDYGATRQRAAQRTAGTLAGSILASLLLWLHLPHVVTLALIAFAVFSFSYTVKRHYGIAVFFVTVFVVLMMEASGPAGATLAVERLLSTLAGGIIALAGATWLWPLWERERMPSILARALRANREYLVLLSDRLNRGAARDETLIAAKRTAESANSDAFASLRRLFADPRNRREGIEQAAALANGNQRLTRLLNLIFVHIESRSHAPAPELARFAGLATPALDALARTVHAGTTAAGELASWRTQLDTLWAHAEAATPVPGSAAAGDAWLTASLGRATLELNAMLLAAEEGAGATTTPTPSTTG